MRGRCLIIEPIHAAGVELLREAGIEPVLGSATEERTICREIVGARAVITRDAAVTAGIMDAAPALEVIGSHGVGIDSIAIEAATERGIAVVNTPGANVRSVAEHALALTFHLAKAISGGDRAARTGDGSFKYRTHFMELDGATFGVAGFGGIGRATARLAGLMGMKLIAWSRSQPDAAFYEEGVVRMPSLESLLAASDIVSLHLPSTAGTRGLIGRAQLARMKSTAFLINTARGALIDEAALVEALRSGTIAGAGLDVFAQEPLPSTSPLRRLENVVLTPHIAGSTEAALRRTGIAVAEQVLMLLAGQRPTHLVNPQAWPRGAEGVLG